MTLQTYLQVKLILGAIALLKIVGADIRNNNVENEDTILRKNINQDEGR